MDNNISTVMNLLEAKYVPQRQPTIRRTSTEEKNPFKILITCLLSLRTTDHNCEIATNRLFVEVNTPQEIVALPIEKLESLIFSSGHYHKKAQVLQSISKELIDRFNSKVPSTKEELMSMKGIGPKTANIVLAFAFDKEVVAVDVHVHVCLNRLGFVKTKTPEQTEVELYKVIPKRYWKELNTVFVLFGQEICQTFSPKCSICPVKNFCLRIGTIRSR